MTWIAPFAHLKKLPPIHATKSTAAIDALPQEKLQTMPF